MCRPPRVGLYWRGGTIGMISTTAEVREQHRFDAAALERYLRVHVTGFSGALTVKQFRGGQSNPTYYLTAGGKEYVLRRKPPGKLLPSAHAVDREYRHHGPRHDRLSRAADVRALHGPLGHRHRVLHHGLRARARHHRPGDPRPDPERALGDVRLAEPRPRAA